MRQATDQEQDRIMTVKARLLNTMKDELTSGEISKAECLSLFAYVTGMLIAMQDQREMTPDQAMEMVSKNIEAGNASAIEQLLGGADLSLQH